MWDDINKGQWWPDKLNKLADPSIEKLLWTWRARVVLALDRSEDLDELNWLWKDVLRFLNNKVSGQQDAKQALAKICSKLWSSIWVRKWPLGSVLFAGPSGAGKNTLVESLAEFFLWDKNSFTRYDAGKTTHGKSDNWALFWTTPWYTDGDVEPILGPELVFDYCSKAQADWVAHESVIDLDDFWIIMIDEVDQLPKSVLKALYSLTEEDEVEMNRWERLMTKNLIIVFATNEWWEQWKKFLDELHPSNKAQYEWHSNRNKQMKQVTKKSITNKFPAWFLSRLELVCFDFLEEQNIDELVDMFLQEINIVWEGYGFSIRYTPEVYTFFRSKLTEGYGARPIWKMLTDTIGRIVNNFVDTQWNERYFNLPHGGVHIEVSIKRSKVVSQITVDEEVNSSVKDDFSGLISKITQIPYYEQVVLYMYKKYLKHLWIDVEEIEVEFERKGLWTRENLDEMFATPYNVERIPTPSQESFETMKKDNVGVFSYLDFGPRLEVLLQASEFSDTLSQITRNPEISSRVVWGIVSSYLYRVSSIEHFDTYVENKSPQIRKEICEALCVSEFNSTIQTQFIQAVQDRKWAIEREKAVTVTN